MSSEWHAQLEASLVSGLERAALRCVGEDCRDLEFDEIVRVSDFEVGEAARCQAKVAGKPEPFEPDIFKSFKAVALLGARRLRSSDSVTAAVSAAMTSARQGTDWLGEYLSGAPIDVRVQITTRAVTWLTRTLDVLGHEDLRGWQYDHRSDWRYPGRGLMLRAKMDLVAPGTPIPTPVLVTRGTDDASLDGAAFRILLWCLSQRRLPAEALLLAHSTGKLLSVDPAGLFDRGLVSAQQAAEAVTLRTSGPDGLTRTPSFFTCQDCEWADGCAERIEALEQRPSVRGGVRMS